jgi:hypothetical protein
MPLDSAPDTPTRRPGDFRRKGTDGPPYIPSLTKTRQPTGNKPELIAKAMSRGLDPSGLTVPQLRELLGTEPADELYARPSGFGDALENQYALRKHIERGIAGGVARLVLAGLDPSRLDLDDIATLDRLVVAAQDAVDSMIWADRGTHVHRLIETYETGGNYRHLIAAGEALGIPAPLQDAIVNGWIEFRAALGVHMLRCEFAIVNDATRTAGTADLLDVADHDIVTEFGTIPAGVPYIGDIKTGDPRDKHAVQVSTYTGGVPFDVDAELRMEWGRAPRADIGLIYHMPMKAALAGEPVVWSAIPVDLAAGREGARICCEARDWPAASVFGAPLKIAAPSTADVEQPTAEPGVPSLSPPAPAVIDVPPMTLWAANIQPVTRRDALRARKTAIESNARDTGWHNEFTRAWRSHGITKDSTDDQVQAALDAIEPPFDPEPVETPTRHIESQPEVERSDGDPIDEATLTHLLEHLAASPHRDTVNRWLKQAADVGESWSPRTRSCVRRYEQTRAARALAEATDGHDDYALVIIAAATGVHGVSVGTALAALTIGEATAVTAVADAFGHRLHLIHAADGTPSLSGDLAAVLAAA